MKCAEHIFYLVGGAVGNDSILKISVSFSHLILLLGDFSLARK